MLPLRLDSLETCRTTSARSSCQVFRRFELLEWARGRWKEAVVVEWVSQRGCHATGLSGQSGCLSAISPGSSSRVHLYVCCCASGTSEEVEDQRPCTTC